MDIEPKEPASVAGTTEDDWHTVTDAKKRKQIQDRLAQRNRRKRLREAKKNNEMQLQPPVNQVVSETQVAARHCCQHLLDATSPLGSPNAFAVVPFAPESSTCPASRCLSFNVSSSNQACSISYEIPFTQTVLSALYLNGEILGIICGTVPCQSPPVPPNVPTQLQPTLTQLLTVHNTGYDRFPFPNMRDNVIIHKDLIDDDEFFRDIFTKPSFSLKPGGAPWDSKAWKIEKPFSEKWGFLFY